MRIIYSDTMTGETEYVDTPGIDLLEQNVRVALSLNVNIDLTPGAWVVVGDHACFIFNWVEGNNHFLFHGAVYSRYDPNFVPIGL